jgi:hypothetical protein
MLPSAVSVPQILGVVEINSVKLEAHINFPADRFLS